MGNADATASDLVALIRILIKRELSKQPKSLAGYIVPGSWDPATATVEVMPGDTLALQDDAVQPPLSRLRLPLIAPSLGKQYGPQGYETVSIVPRAHGYAAVIEHDETTSPGAPAGETWDSHYNATGDVDAYIHLTNDPAIKILAGVLLDVVTAGGIEFRLDDAVPRASLKVGSLEFALDGAAGKIFLGSTALGANDAVVTKQDLQSAINALAALCYPGSGVTPPTVTGSSVTESDE